MWDDELDRKIKEAAEQIQPGPDESAWQKMEKLLDENLPQKKDRKWLFIFLPLLLLTATGLWYFHLSEHNRRMSSGVPAKAAVAFGPDHTPVDGRIKEGMSNRAVGGQKTRTVAGGVMPPDLPLQGASRTGGKPAVSMEAKYGSPASGNAPESPEQKLRTTQQMTQAATGDSETNISASVYKKSIPKRNDSVATAAQTSNADVKMPPVQGNARNYSKSSKALLKAAHPVAPRLSFWVSAGPAVSYVSGSSGKLTMAAGAGAAYDLSKNFSIRTGVIVAKKIYSATGGQYNYNGGSSYSYLQKVSANCKVIDIPLNLDYHFGQKNNHSWVLSAGLSSYLMKKESYLYLFKTPAGQYYNKSRTYSNQNRHLLSVLDLSVGYYRQLGKRFSLGAQPYMDVPLTGIGAGKVKLNSAGLYMTLQARPFVKKTR